MKCMPCQRFDWRKCQCLVQINDPLLNQKLRMLCIQFGVCSRCDGQWTKSCRL